MGTGNVDTLEKRKSNVTNTIHWLIIDKSKTKSNLDNLFP